MLNKQFFKLFVLTTLISASFTTFAADQLPTSIISKEPDAKELVVEPTDYESCTTTKARWVNNVWHPAFKICKFDLKNPKAQAQGEGWSAGHWACTQYQIMDGLGGQCTNWAWQPSQWVKNYKELEVTQ